MKKKKKKVSVQTTNPIIEIVEKWVMGLDEDRTTYDTPIKVFDNNEYNQLIDKLKEHIFKP
jgi:hypothetical protein